jgi:hypothetical protein
MRERVDWLQVLREKDVRQPSNGNWSRRRAGTTRAAAQLQLLAIMTKICAVLILSLAVPQPLGTRAGRFGSVGRGLSDAEITEINQLASNAGRLAWLVIGFPSMLSGLRMVTVYLEPDATNVGVHRGRMLNLVADDPPTVPQRSPWRVKAVASYAYIIEPNDPRREITDERDIRWPFAVDGDIDDATLISVVTFIRSRPGIRGVPEGQFPREVAVSPISVIARRGDQYIVALRTSEATGERVTLNRTDAGSEITHVDRWIV